MKKPNRAKLVDELMERDEFADLWAANGLRISRWVGETIPAQMGLTVRRRTLTISGFASR